MQIGVIDQERFFLEKYKFVIQTVSQSKFGDQSGGKRAKEPNYRGLLPI